MRYWFAEQQCGPPAWIEVATFLLMLLIPPELRMTLRSDDFKPKCARPLAGYNACLLCGLELHAALRDPCGPPDFDYVYDGPFLHGLAGRSKIDLSKAPVWTPEMPPNLQRDFDVLLRALLASLAGRMKPVLRGSASGRDKPWLFSAKAQSNQQLVEATVQDDAAQGKNEKRCRKKLAEIAKLEEKQTKGSLLSEEEQQKIAKKQDLQLELDTSSAASEGIDLLKIWGIP
ncbi:unnamed protein product [Polarella glacialis]|uniref:Uncharacterized protein n=1 Tax=Polarella glacialis TaxID=89957 RepID=A0A813DR64_POLGL|nr:unnamed protein product [Polarella glacialis]